MGGAYTFPRSFDGSREGHSPLYPSLLHNKVGVE